MVGQGLVRLTGQWGSLMALGEVVKNTTIPELEKSLERSALELLAKMKEGIASRSLGLAPNTELTQRLKGGNIPLIDSSQMWQNITMSKLIDKAPSGGDEEYRAYFVGVNRKAPMHRATGSELGSPKPISLYNIARKQVKGYTVVLPRTGIQKKVPARDFRKKPYKEHKKRHKELMQSGVSSAFTTGLTRTAR